MLFCETARTGSGDADDLAVFVSQLAALGLPARVAAGSVPDGLGANLQFDLAPRIADGGMQARDGLALLAADQLGDAALVRLRRLAGEAAPLTVRAFGCFDRPESELGARARLAYVFGREPEIFALPVPGERPESRPSAPAFGVPGRAALRPAGAPPQILLVSPDLKDPLQAAALAALAPRHGFRVTVLTDSRGKQAWIAEHGREIPLYHYGEALPLALAERADACVVFGRIGGSYRLRTLVANLLVAGVPLLDGSSGHRIAAASDAFIPAPPGIVGLDRFLSEEILPNLGRISELVRASEAASAASAQPVLSFLGEGLAEATRRRRAPAGPAAGGIVFMPTNGIGLGHAQRSALVAGAMRARGPGPVFAAFPSCMPMVKSYGFDVMPLIGRSTLHAQSHEHDLANYLRLRALAAGARALVFDGGFVFDSVYRTLLEGGIPGVWIRRGLWQAGQDNSVALDREKAFGRVIVPGEAFAELNAPSSHGERIEPVGPIVQAVTLSAQSRFELRAQLMERYGRPFERLVVSLLGAGVAADRGMQIQVLSNLFERRADTLHLVLIWPSGLVEPGWFGWRNTRVVRTRHAAALTAAADLAVTASGYNSFHETIYNRVPAIFVPQLAPSTDDQRARARAAADRGLGAVLEPQELMRLERLVTQYLDDGESDALRARLAAAELPEPGTERAAQLIEEVAYGPDAVARDAFPDRSARRG